MKRPSNSNLLNLKKTCYLRGTWPDQHVHCPTNRHWKRKKSLSKTRKFWNTPKSSPTDQPKDKDKENNNEAIRHDMPWFIAEHACENVDSSDNWEPQALQSFAGFAGFTFFTLLLCLHFCLKKYFLPPFTLQYNRVIATINSIFLTKTSNFWLWQETFTSTLVQKDDI